MLQQMVLTMEIMITSTTMTRTTRRRPDAWHNFVDYFSKSVVVGREIIIISEEKRGEEKIKEISFRGARGISLPLNPNRRENCCNFFLLFFLFLSRQTKEKYGFVYEMACSFSGIEWLYGSY